MVKGLLSTFAPHFFLNTKNLSIYILSLSCDSAVNSYDGKVPQHSETLSIPQPAYKGKGNFKPAAQISLIWLGMRYTLWSNTFKAFLSTTNQCQETEECHQGHIVWFLAFVLHLTQNRQAECRETKRPFSASSMACTPGSPQAAVCLPGPLYPVQIVAASFQYQDVDT